MYTLHSHHSTCQPGHRVLLLRACLWFDFTHPSSVFFSLKKAEFLHGGQIFFPKALKLSESLVLNGRWKMPYLHLECAALLEIWPLVSWRALQTHVLCPWQTFCSWKEVQHSTIAFLMSGLKLDEACSLLSAKKNANWLPLKSAINLHI